MNINIMILIIQIYIYIYIYMPSKSSLKINYVKNKKYVSISQFKNELCKESKICINKLSLKIKDVKLYKNLRGLRC